jgi:hypothetical protein
MNIPKKILYKTAVFFLSVGIGFNTCRTAEKTGGMNDEADAGRRLYRNKCGNCHMLYPPRSYSLSEWREVMARMSNNADLTAREVGLILAWLGRHE